MDPSQDTENEFDVLLVLSKLLLQIGHLASSELFVGSVASRILQITFGGTQCVETRGRDRRADFMRGTICTPASRSDLHEPIRSRFPIDGFAPSLRVPGAAV